MTNKQFNKELAKLICAAERHAKLAKKKEARNHVRTCIVREHVRRLKPRKR